MHFERSSAFRHWLLSTRSIFAHSIFYWRPAATILHFICLLNRLGGWMLILCCSSYIHGILPLLHCDRYSLLGQCTCPRHTDGGS